MKLRFGLALASAMTLTLGGCAASSGGGGAAVPQVSGGEVLAQGQSP